MGAGVAGRTKQVIIAVIVAIGLAFGTVRLWNHSSEPTHKQSIVAPNVNAA